MNISRWPAQILIAPIRFYQRFITPYTPASCRYYPTCSSYAVTALRTRGAVVGSGLTIWRLLRCNPWSEGGIDHVPASGWRSAAASSGGPTAANESDDPVDPTESTAAPAGDPADLSGPPPSGGPGTTIRRFAA